MANDDMHGALTLAPDEDEDDLCTEDEREHVLNTLETATGVLDETWSVVMTHRFWGVSETFHEFFVSRGLDRFACDIQTRNTMIHLMINQGTKRRAVEKLFGLSQSQVSRVMTGADAHAAAKHAERKREAEVNKSIAEEVTSETAPDLMDFPTGKPRDDHDAIIEVIYKFFKKLNRFEMREVCDQLNEWCPSDLDDE